MDRVALLRWGYGALGLSLAGFGASVQVGALVFAGIVFALAGAVLLLASQDDVPKWSGLALVAYFVATLVAFVAATPVTVRLEWFKGFLNDDPSPLAGAIFAYLILAMPLMVVGTAVAAAWEREWPPRLLLWGGLGGLLVVNVLGLVLLPRGDPDLEAGVARVQGDVMRTLFALSCAAGALGALWAATRPDEYT